MKGIISDYQVPNHVYDEVFEHSGVLRDAYRSIFSHLNGIDFEVFKLLNQDAKLSFLNQGITYALYSENETMETIFPFDLFPRMITNREWHYLHDGLIQRNTALNLFIQDVYNERRILRERIIPEDLVLSSKHYVKMMEEIKPVGDIYTHICGTDLIRHSDGNFYVLEDNLRSPSGVSYVLSNRVTLSRTLPSIFRTHQLYEVSDYPLELRRTLESVSNRLEEPCCVVLTPGQYNSAYYEHSFLAKKMGVELVEGKDLFVEDGKVYMNTIGRRQRVDVIYRRIDDAFIDPKVFRKDSVLGVHGLMDAYQQNNVTIVNAPGTGISDDKAVCSYVPDMIKFYLDQEPIIPNVPTYMCHKEEDLQYVLDNIEKMVVKPVDMSGGYGVMICDTLSKEELDELKTKIKENGREFIAQPKMMLSTHSTFIEGEGKIEPRHVDLRTFTLMGKDRNYVLPGGLSRVALKKDSLIVNSSQGGGSKDTWVLIH